MRRRWIPIFTLAITAVGWPAAAATRDGGSVAASSLGHVTFEADDAPAAPLVALHATFDSPSRQQTIVASPNPTRPMAFEYSHAYQVRNKIHHIASFATLPLFAAEAYIGQKMFNAPGQITPNMRHLHGNISTAIAVLFSVNSVTGVWNMVEGRKDPNGAMLRTIHGVLMLVADAGFLATALTHPNSRSASGVAIYDPKKNQHMALAYASVSTATVGYVIMLFRR